MRIKITRGGCQAAALGFDVGNELLWQDFDHGLGGQLVHRVVLVVAAGKVGKLFPGEFVDALDHLNHGGWQDYFRLTLASLC